MKNFFEAKKIAVIGASRNEEKVGHVIFKNLIQNKDLRVFPVNPNASSIMGEKAYSSIGEIPFIIDLAVIVIPAEGVLEALGECGKKGVNKVIILSAGFAESGNNDLTEKIKQTAKEYNIRIIGPNVLGIINPYKNLNASFFKQMPEKGSVAFISQSGAVGTSILDKAIERNLGFSGFVSLGNMIDVDFLSALEYFGEDIRTSTIMLYIESLKPETGLKFVEICRKISQKKNIIAIKAGKTKQGEKAARTHTASLSSSAKIYEGAFRQAGIIEVESLDSMLKLAEISSKYGRIGKKACIITNAGGLGVLTTDVLSKAGIEILEIPEKLLKELDVFMPKGYSRNNPLDILGDALAERYEKVLKFLTRFSLFDFFVVILSPQAMTQSLETVQALAKIAKPIFIVLEAGQSFDAARKFLKTQRKIIFNDVFDLRILGKILNF